MAAPLPKPAQDYLPNDTRYTATLYPPGTIVMSKRNHWVGRVLPYDTQFARWTFPVQWLEGAGGGGLGVCRLAMGYEVDVVRLPGTAPVTRLE